MGQPSNKVKHQQVYSLSEQSFTPISVQADAISIAAVGEILAYTVPAGKKAIISFASIIPSAAGAVVELRITRAAVIISLLFMPAVDTQKQHSGFITLIAADKISWHVITVLAAATADVHISGTELDA